MADEPSTPKTVTVLCAVPNGVVLQLMGSLPDDEGRPRRISVGPRVELVGPKPSHGHGLRTDGAVRNEGVDEEFIRRWLKDNEGSPLASMISIEEPAKGEG